MRKIYDNLVIVLLAGGVGNRLHSQTSKHLINYDNETILEKNIIRFQKYIKNVPIQVVSNVKDITNINELNNLEPIINWFFDRVAALSSTKDRKVSFFRIKRL